MFYPLTRTDMRTLLDLSVIAVLSLGCVAAKPGEVTEWNVTASRQAILWQRTSTCYSHPMSDTATK